MLIQALQQMQRPLLVVGTKADRLGGNQLRNSLVTLQRELQVEKVLPVASKSGKGIPELWNEIVQALPS